MELLLLWKTIIIIRKLIIKLIVINGILLIMLFPSSTYKHLIILIILEHLLILIHLHLLKILLLENILLMILILIILEVDSLLLVVILGINLSSISLLFIHKVLKHIKIYIFRFNISLQFYFLIRIIIYPRKKLLSFRLLTKFNSPAIFFINQNIIIFNIGLSQKLPKFIIFFLVYIIYDNFGYFLFNFRYNELLLFINCYYIHFFQRS